MLLVQTDSNNFERPQTLSLHLILRCHTESCLFRTSRAQQYDSTKVKWPGRMLEGFSSCCGRLGGLNIVDRLLCAHLARSLELLSTIFAEKPNFWDHHSLLAFLINLF